MQIGIDASRAFTSQRTGIEEYSYQVIKNLRDKLQNMKVVLYIRKNQKIDFDLPVNWRIKIIKFPYLWTQLGLSLEMLFHPVDVLFVPSHVVPIIHPKKTVVTIHGLEFEVFPEYYSFWAKLYMRWSIKMSCRWAKKIIAVSENTKKDLIRLYNVPKNKIEVVYEGISDNPNSTRLPRRLEDEAPRNDADKPYLLFIGRLEKRKNIEGIVEAYEILKEKYNIAHKLVLVGKPGFGFSRDAMSRVLRKNIIFTGFVSEKEKYNLLQNADVFLFPTFYEGFGLPVLEAQSAGVPAVTSNISSLPEVGGDGVMYCDPHDPKSIADAVYKVISNQGLKDDIIKKGYENVLRFSWSKCAEQIKKIVD